MDRAFFERDPETVAQALLGCVLERRLPDGVIRVRLTETEAYKGSEDAASHAYRGMTNRNAVMFGETGRLYVYLIYGLHHCLNVVAHEPGFAGAVLLRAGEPLEGLELVRRFRPGVPDKRLMDGPGKLAAALAGDRSLNGADLLTGGPERPFRLTDRAAEPPFIRTPRIGISQAKDAPWRFLARQP